MKFGVRKPSIKKSIKARTTGKIKRTIKRSVNPTYGKKGMGFVNNPKKAIYNKVYNKTTVSVSDILKSTSRKTRVSQSEKDNAQEISYSILEDAKKLTNTINKAYLPNVFFDSYNQLLAYMEKLVSLEPYCNYSVKSASQNLSEILEKREFTIKEFIDRYYNYVCKKIKSETNRDTISNFFIDSLEKYNSYMLESNILYYNELYNNIKSMTIEDIKNNVAKNSPIPYEIIDNYSVKIWKRIYNRSQLQKISVTSIVVAIVLFLVSYFYWFTFYLSLFCFWYGYANYKIYKTLEK